MPEFTKGEWKIVHEFNVSSGNRGIASCGGYTTNTKDSEKIHRENIANAHLISAAPEMYEKLKKVSNWLDLLIKQAERQLKDCHYETLKDALIHDLKNYQVTKGDVDSALAKAEGK